MKMNIQVLKKYLFYIQRDYKTEKIFSPLLPKNQHQYKD